MIDFTKVQALSFDCYGTLIDWETGILRTLRPWMQRCRREVGDDVLLETFGECEPEIEERYPSRPYREILGMTQKLVAERLRIPCEDSDTDRFAASVGQWPPFADSVDALARLQRRFRLIILSNVDHQSFAGSRRQLRANFDAVITAEDVGAYKPDYRMFDRLLHECTLFDIDKAHLVHVAQSLYHDHVPAKHLGLTTVWVDRRHGQSGNGATRAVSGNVTPDLTVSSLAELADVAGC